MPGLVPAGFHSLEFLLTALKEAYWTDIPGMTEIDGDAGLRSSIRSLREEEIWSCLRRLLVQGRYRAFLLDDDGDIHPIPPERWRGDALGECDRWGGSKSDRARGEAKVKLTIEGRERAGWVLIQEEDLTSIYAAPPWRESGAPLKCAPLPASLPAPAIPVSAISVPAGEEGDASTQPSKGETRLLQRVRRAIDKISAQEDIERLTSAELYKKVGDELGDKTPSRDTVLRAAGRRR